MVVSGNLEQSTFKVEVPEKHFYSDAEIYRFNKVKNERRSKNKVARKQRKMNIKRRS